MYTISGTQGEQKIAAFNFDLQMLDGWPQFGNGQHVAAVIVGIFANGNNLNIMSNEWHLDNYLGYIYMYDYLRNNLNWSPLRPFGIVASTACADLDKDGSVEIIANSHFANINTNYRRTYITVWTIPGIPFTQADFPWPQINHDRYRSNQYDFVPNDEVVGINTVSSNVPGEFSLYRNYPNPFNPLTKIKFDVKKTEPVSLKIYDGLGREKLTLINQILQPGVCEVTFDGSAFSSGIYFYTFETNSYKKNNENDIVKIVTFVLSKFVSEKKI